MLSMLLNATSKAECQFAMYHLGLWDLLSPHMISQSCTGLNSKKKKVFILLGRGKHPLGPSVTASRLSTVQDGLRTHQPTPPPCPPAVRAGKTCMPHVMFQTLPSAKSGRCESNTKLSLIFWICHSTGSRAGGGIPAVTTPESKARPWPSWIQSNGSHWRKIQGWMVMQQEKSTRWLKANLSLSHQRKLHSMNSLI